MRNKLRIDIISTLPDVFESVFSTGIIRIAREKELAEIRIHNLHDYSKDKFGHVDDTPYGGGAGMLIMCEPVFDVIEKLQAERNYDEIIYLTADGMKYNQSTANELSLKKNIILICGRYKGIDQRIRDTLVTREISVGDFVLSGGEIPAMILTDTVIRLLPGALSDAESALDDSFQDGLLEPPYYTRPANFRGMEVPKVLIEGNHKAIKEWRLEKAREKTEKRRPDLLEE
jgi:tRNA (guanine37-N1)-methyltransferase